MFPSALSLDFLLIWKRDLGKLSTRGRLVTPKRMFLEFHPLLIVGSHNNTNLHLRFSSAFLPRYCESPAEKNHCASGHHQSLLIVFGSIGLERLLVHLFTQDDAHAVLLA